MKLLIDMNLSPRWVEFLVLRGRQAQHWSTLGEAKASDETIMTLARSRGDVVVTSDLDFGTLLALSGDDGPSVIQLRASILAPEVLGPRLLECLARFESQIKVGALIVLDNRRSKVRLLPIGERR